MELATQSRSAAARGRVFRGEALRNVAMPLGGIGTGQIAIAGDGGLRQWQISNIPNHLASVPDAFFALATTVGDVTTSRILQSEEVLALPPLGTPCVNDEVVPAHQRELVARWGGVERTTFTGAYPFATVTYEDAELPLEVSMEAFNPFIPLDDAGSEIPGIVFRFSLHNPGPVPVTARLGGAQKNIVGWDGCFEIEGNYHPLFGGNVNTLKRANGRTYLVMENPSLPTDHPGQGQLTLVTDAEATAVIPEATWQRTTDFMHVLAGTGELTPPGYSWQLAAPRIDLGLESGMASRAGETVNGGLIVETEISPGETAEVRFVLAWRFPNHYVHHDQWMHTYQREIAKSRLWLGTHYSTLYPTAIAAADTLFDRLDVLESSTRRWVETFHDSTLDETMQDFLLAQGSLIRSPTTFRTDDGRFFGFEGSKGASTANDAPIFGGSCPMNCTHVWNYEMALSRLFPALERSMRETDYGVTQAPEGYINHRVVLPVWLTQPWGNAIAGPENPALDGMLGTLLKTYREVQQGGGTGWLAEWWPRVTKLYHYITTTWDVNGDGVLVGEQPNTFDIEFYGENIFIGALWLAALRATEEMAKLLGDDTVANDSRRRFELGTVNYDQRLWGGEYYIQTLQEDETREQQFLTGCLADQLLGQWWAFTLGLGCILPEEHVKQTLTSIARYNWRTDFYDIDPEERTFADKDDHGLLILAWPLGDRPDRPTRYHDEVWTGIEYQVAAACIHVGHVEDGLRIFEAARTRHNGVKRNPYNDIECGDHYARAMSGWSVLEALAGYRYDAATHSLRFRPEAEGACRFPFVAATGWGEVRRDAEGRIAIDVRSGEVAVARLDIAADGAVEVGGAGVDARREGEVTVLGAPVSISEGATLTVG